MDGTRYGATPPSNAFSESVQPSRQLVPVETRFRRGFPPRRTTASRINQSITSVTEDSDQRFKPPRLIKLVQVTICSVISLGGQVAAITAHITIESCLIMTLLASSKPAFLLSCERSSLARWVFEGLASLAWFGLWSWWRRWSWGRSWRRRWCILSQANVSAVLPDLCGFLAVPPPREQVLTLSKF